MAVKSRSFRDAVVKLLPSGLTEEEMDVELDRMGLNLKTMGANAVKNYLKMIAERLPT